MNILYKQMKRANNLREKHPAMNMNDGKIHCLYLHCLFNSDGYYRMFLPSEALNKSSTHSAIIGTFHKEDFSRSFQDYDNVIAISIIQWADYIIIPPIYTDIASLQQAILKVNPTVKFVMDINKNIFQKSLEAPLSYQENLMVFKNLTQVNLITTSTEELAVYLNDVLRSEGYLEIQLAVLPDLISEAESLNRNEQSKSDTNRFRLGLVGFSNKAEDFASLQPTFYKLSNTMKDRFELVLFGWDGTHLNQDLFDTCNVEIVKSVSFIKYLEILGSLQLDAALLPISRDQFQAFGKSAITFSEFASLSIPVITDQKSIYNNIIQDGQTGLIVSHEKNWETRISQLIDDTIASKSIGQKAHKEAFKRRSWNQANVSLITQLYSFERYVNQCHQRRNSVNT